MDQVKPNEWLAEKQDPAKPSTKTRSIAGLAWFLFFLSIAMFLGGVISLLLVPENLRGLNGYDTDYRIGFISLAYSLLGTLIAARHPKNPVGWILCAIGLGGVVQVLAIGYLVYAHAYFPNSIQFPLLIFTLLINFWVVENALGPWAFLSFPNGELPSPRWRIIAWFPVLLGLLMYLLAIPAPLAGMTQSQFLPPISLLVGPIRLDFLIASTAVIMYLFDVMFIFASIGIFQRLRQSKGEQREQMKWVVYAGALSVAISVGLSILIRLPLIRVLDPAAHNTDMLFLGIPVDFSILILPIAVFIAIFKYRLYDIDLIINRTLVYVPLTGILAGLYSASITLFQKLFIAFTGQKSDAAIVVSTLFLATTFTPIKNSLQISVDRRFKDSKDPLKEFKAFGKQVETVAEVINIQRTTRRLLDTSMAAFNVSCGAIFLEKGGELVLAHASAGWKEGSGVLNLPMDHAGVQLGRLVLSVRNDQKSYSPDDCQTLQQEVDRVAEIVWLTQVTPQVGRATRRRKFGSPNR